MTDMNKKPPGKGRAKGKKLQLNKETLRDLTSSEAGAKRIKGGAMAPDPTMNRTQCEANRCD